MPEEKLVLSIIKALNILDILAIDDYKKNGLGLFELSKKTNIKPNTLHNILKTMISCGYVLQKSDSKYVAGHKCEFISNINHIVSDNILKNSIKPILSECSIELGESMVLTALVNGERRCLIDVQNDSQITVNLNSVENKSIFEYPTGLILASIASEYEFKYILSKNKMECNSWININNMNQLQEILNNIRTDGYCIKNTDNYEVFGLAVPIATKSIKCSLGLYIPKYRLNEKLIPDYIKKITKVAHQIEKILDEI